MGGTRHALLAVFAGAMVGCGTSNRFNCSQDLECVSGEARGQCEDNGYCSFFDPDCESERRYGDLSPRELSGVCVPPSVDDETSTHETTDTQTSIGTGSSGGTDATISSTTPLTATLTSDATGPTSDGTSRSTSESTTGSGESTVTADSSTGGPRCGTFFSEDFSDGIIDPSLQIFDAMTTAEANGELELTLTPPAGGYPGVALDGVDFTSAWARVELGTTPPVTGIQLSFQILTDEATLLFVVLSNELRLREHPTGQVSTELLVVPFDIMQHRWLQLRSSGGIVSFEVSPDGQAWTSLVNHPTMWDLSSVRLDAAATDWADIEEQTVVSYRSYEFCGDPEAG